MSHKDARNGVRRDERDRHAPTVRQPPRSPRHPAIACYARPYGSRRDTPDRARFPPSRGGVDRHRDASGGKRFDGRHGLAARRTTRRPGRLHLRERNTAHDQRAANPPVWRGRADLVHLRDDWVRLVGRRGSERMGEQQSLPDRHRIEDQRRDGRRLPVPGVLPVFPSLQPGRGQRAEPEAEPAPDLGAG